MHGDLREAPPSQEVDHRIAILRETAWGRMALGSAEAAVVEDEDGAALGQVEVQPVGLIRHRFVVCGIRVAPHNDRPTLVVRQILQWHILLAAGGGGLLLPRSALGALRRDEHGVEPTAAVCAHPVVLRRKPQEQFCPQLVQIADCGNLQKSPGAGADAIRRSLQIVEDREHLLESLNAAGGLSFGLRHQGCTVQCIAQWHFHHILCLALEPVVQRDLGSPVHDLRAAQPHLHALHEDLELCLFLGELDLVALLHAEIPGQTFYHHEAQQSALQRRAGMVNCLMLACSFGKEAMQVLQVLRKLSRHLGSVRGLGVAAPKKDGAWEDQDPHDQPQHQPKNGDIKESCTRSCQQTCQAHVEDGDQQEDEQDHRGEDQTQDRRTLDAASQGQGRR
mmetsp:Transcript_86018/g.206143  ORF Transcript_86018/g.206143 Transcript_86018/m.206143 type:complete len:392 (-) Transcript_86018:16-1191(-)